MYNRKKNQRKAISPMIASVFLIMFVIALSTIVVNWLKGYTQDQTEETDVMTSANIDCIKQNIRINRVYMVKNSTDTNMTVRVLMDNTGTVAANVSSIETFDIYGSTCTLASTTGSTTVGAGDQIIWENTSCSMLYDGAVTTCTDKFQEIRATTTCGNTHIFNTATDVNCQTVT